MKMLRFALLFVGMLLIIYFAGPRPSFEEIEDPQISLLEMSLDSLDQYVKTKDLTIPNLKPDNESRIIWADSIRKTRYSVVYLHGFSASPMESNPTHINFAKHYGFNLYIPLLAGHGRDDDNSFADLTPNDLIQSAKEAIAIGQLLGDDVIVMSCSTGSTLAIYLAGANKELIDAQIMYSPNISLNDPTARLITGPWGNQILKMVAGDYWNLEKVADPPESAQYWTITYSTKGLIALQKLLNDTMTPEVFEKVTQPFFLGYYYKNEEEQDHTISTHAIHKFFNQAGTPSGEKVLMAFPNAGAHVMANPMKGQDVENVFNKTCEYAERVLHLEPLADSLNSFESY